jgi:hypothetical protein
MASEVNRSLVLVTVGNIHSRSRSRYIVSYMPHQERLMHGSLIVIVVVSVQPNIPKVLVAANSNRVTGALDRHTYHREYFYDLTSHRESASASKH